MLGGVAAAKMCQNEVNEICQAEIELDLRDMDREPEGAWDTVRDLMLLDTSTLGSAGPSAPAGAVGVAVVEVEVDAFASGPTGLLPPLDPTHQPPLRRWRWRI